MFDYVTLVKVRGAEAGKTTEVTRQAYNRNKDGVFKDWQVKDKPQAITQSPKWQPASEDAAGDKENQDSEFEGYTVKQLKAYAEQEGIEYANPINKAELIELIKTHTTKK